MPDDILLYPTVAQDADSGDVLMLAYSSAQSLRRSLETGEAHYWSRSRGRLWRKGETSGNSQALVSVAVDCDGDALLFRVRPAGPACHTGARSCFFTPVERPQAVFPAAGAGPAPQGAAGDVFAELFRVIEERKVRPQPGSYTSRLLQEGTDRMARKIAEEAGEVIIAAKNRSDSELLSEAADLVYHLMVLLAGQGLSWSRLAAELERRRK